MGGIDRHRIEQYGECTSVRVWYTDGLEVEYGLVPLNRIALPLDPGTERTLADGYRILKDKMGLFSVVSRLIPERR